MLRFAFRAFILSLVLFGCNPQNPQPGENDFIADPDHPSSLIEEGEIIYSLNIPTDIVSFFEETGTGFDPSVTCPLERIPMYENPEHIAILLGVLGVDLSYCTLFERVAESAEYYNHIDLLADKLELPEEILDNSPLHDQSNLDDVDSLRNLIDQIYSEMDAYFKKRGQSSLASLSLLGGWVETMYIGVSIYKDKEILEMGDRILQQKYSLNSLSGLLASEQESLMIRRYMHSVNKLKEVYNEVDIRYETEGFEMDSTEQAFHARVAEISYAPETLEKICRMVIQLREDILPLVNR
jgi:hypothetical protein